MAKSTLWKISPFDDCDWLRVPLAYREIRPVNRHAPLTYLKLSKHQVECASAAHQTRLQGSVTRFTRSKFIVFFPPLTRLLGKSLKRCGSTWPASLHALQPFLYLDLFTWNIVAVYPASPSSRFTVIIIHANCCSRAYFEKLVTNDVFSPL